MASIYQSIEILSKEKGIDPQIVLDAVKDAMLVAARKHFRTTEDLVADLDKSGSIQIYGVRKVVEQVQDPGKEISLNDARKLDAGAVLDAEVRIPKPTEALGRISAQTAKQVILQKVREAERETIHSEYSGRVGELVNCTVKRIESQDLVVDLGKTEARLPKKEQSRLENFSVSDRVRCVIKSVEKAGKNAGVIVSRAAPDLVMRLFEQEVPEIYDNTVVIKACAREAGERTKIAVVSRDRDVDSVGACVGMKGMRVQSIIRELRGEKIDIIEYSEDPVLFATHALSPAKISRVSILDLQGKHMEVIVDDTQLSLAIGKKGQNVRLAAKLLGWKIDIKSEEEKRQEVESQMAALVVPGAPVSVLLDHGLIENILERLVEGGIGTVEKLGSMTPEELESIAGIEPEMVERIQDSVNSYYSQFEAAPTAPEEEVVQEHWNTPEGEAAYAAQAVAAEAAENGETPEQDAEQPGDGMHPAGAQAHAE
ncbi:MAG: transcription termination/antitermination protein NusA [Acidobacteria bacterium]|nr:transcription termination/antitermination protein NusA [Acidobacteriota bacterium]